MNRYIRSLCMVAGMVLIMAAAVVYRPAQGVTARASRIGGRFQLIVIPTSPSRANDFNYPRFWAMDTVTGEVYKLEPWVKGTGRVWRKYYGGIQ